MYVNEGEDVDEGEDEYEPEYTDEGPALTSSLSTTTAPPRLWGWGKTPSYGEPGKEKIRTATARRKRWEPINPTKAAKEEGQKLKATRGGGVLRYNKPQINKKNVPIYSYTQKGSDTPKKRQLQQPEGMTSKTRQRDYISTGDIESILPPAEVLIEGLDEVTLGGAKAAAVGAANVDNDLVIPVAHPKTLPKQMVAGPTHSHPESLLNAPPERLEMQRVLTTPRGGPPEKPAKKAEMLKKAAERAGRIINNNIVLGAAISVEHSKKLFAIGEEFGYLEAAIADEKTEEYKIWYKLQKYYDGWHVMPKEMSPETKAKLATSPALFAWMMALHKRYENLLLLYKKRFGHEFVPRE
jgi:hypothetical protein